MTAAQLQAWLESRQPAPPTVLAKRLSYLLTACPPDRLTASSSLSESLGALGIFALEAVNDSGREPTDREVALDLLAADAFVTFAFEAAAEETEGRLDRVATELLVGVE